MKISWILFEQKDDRMLKPTHHYEDLRKVLYQYVADDCESYVDCVAHVLLDIQVWVGNAELFCAAVRKSADLAMEQHEKALQDLGYLENA